MNTLNTMNTMNTPSTAELELENILGLVPDTLPGSLPALMRVATADLLSCVRTPGYSVDMGRWYVPASGVCTVCLAGSVIAKRLLPVELPAELTEVEGICPSMFSRDISLKLSAVNTASMGSFLAAYSYWLGEQALKDSGAYEIVAPYSETYNKVLLPWEPDTIAQSCAIVLEHTDRVDYALREAGINTRFAAVRPSSLQAAISSMLAK